MPRHDGSRYERTRKQRARRGRNRQSFLDTGGPIRQQPRRRKK